MGRQLVGAKLAQARAGRWSRQVGQRFDGVKTLTEAAKLARELAMDRSVFGELRDEMIACLALVDVRPFRGPWEGWPAGSSGGLGFDSNLERYARSDMRGNVEVRQVEGDWLLARLPGFGGVGSGAADFRFSPDGSLLAVSYWHQIPGRSTNFQVWDWQRQSVIFQPAVAVGCFDFAPDGRLLALGHADATVTVYATAGWTVAGRLKLDASPSRVAFHPDGKRLAVAEANGRVALWEMTTSKLFYKNSTPGVASLAWHPRGDLLAVGCNDRTVQCWNGATGQDAFVLKGHQNNGIAVAFVADGDILVSAAWDNTTRLWDPRTKRELLRFAGDHRHVSRDGRRVAGQNGHLLTVWDLDPAREYRLLAYRPENEGRPQARTVSPDGRWLLTSGAACRIWDLALWQEVATLAGGVVSDVKFQPDGQKFFTCGPAGLHRWSFQTGAGVLQLERVAQLLPPGRLERLVLDRKGDLLAVSVNQTCTLVDTKNPPGRLRRLPHVNALWPALSPDGRWAAAGVFHGSGVKVWEAPTGKVVKELLRNEAVAAAIFSADGKWLLTATGAELQLWKPGSWQPIRRRTLAQPAEPMNVNVFAPDGKVLAAVDSQTSVLLFETDTLQPLARLQGADGDLISEIVFTPDGSRLVVSGSGGTLRLWDLRRIRQQLAAADLDWDQLPYPPLPPRTDVKPVRVESASAMEERQLVGHTGEIWWVAFSPDGRVVLSASHDHTLRAWDASSGKELRCFRGHTGAIYGVALSADGRRLLSGGSDGTVRLWDLASGKALHCQDGMGWVASVAFSRDGRRALITNHEGLTRLWDVNNWRELRRFRCAENPWSVAFSPDDCCALIAGGTADARNRQILRLWDLKDGKDLDRFKQPNVRGQWQAVFSPDGRRVLAGGQDTCLYLSDVATGKELQRFRGHSHAVLSVAFSSDGRRALSTSCDRTVRLWDVASGAQLGSLGPYGDRELRGVAFSPDGSHAVFGSANGSVRLVALPPVKKAPPKAK